MWGLRSSDRSLQGGMNGEKLFTERPAGVCYDAQEDVIKSRTRLWQWQ